MRLADLIVAAAGGVADRNLAGALSSMRPKIEAAQHFEIGSAMVEAADLVRKRRPSTMVAALPMVRYPYPICWFEWLASAARFDRSDATPERPRPQRVGVLVECIDDTLRCGHVTWAWNHPDKAPVVCPLGMIFDNTDNRSLLEEARRFARQTGADLRPAVEAETRAGMKRSEIFAELAEDPREVRAAMELEERWRVAPTPHTMEMLRLLLLLPGGSEALHNATQDLQGEPMFLTALVILLNSRNVVYRNEEDLSRLNRARARARKLPLQTFNQTNIMLSRVQSNRAGNMASDIERRRHLVMGHFKVRRTGVFWWSPFQRGSAARGELHRRQYHVEADPDLKWDLATAIAQGEA